MIAFPGSERRSGSEHPAPVLVRLPNYVGDSVMAWPALARLIAAGLHPSLLGPRWAADLFAGSGLAIDPYPRGLGARLTTLRHVAQRSGGRRILLLTHSFSSALEARLAGLAAIGFRKDGRGPLLTTSMGVFPRGHQVDAYWRLADGLCPPAAAPDTVRLPITETARAAARARLEAAGIADRFVLLCPQSGGRHQGHDKDWPAFPDLADALERHGLITVATPGPGEAEGQRQRLVRTRILDGLGLLDVAAIAEQAALVIANDCGLGHVAAAAGTPILSLFGHTDPDRTRPRSPVAEVLGGTGWPSLDQTLALAQRMLASSAEPRQPCLASQASRSHSYHSCGP